MENEHPSILPASQQISNFDAHLDSSSHNVGNRGYDVISDLFFVQEKDTANNQICTTYFSDFSDYRKYLRDDIYSSACYYQVPLSKLPPDINTDKLLSLSSFISYTIDDCRLPTLSNHDSCKYTRHVKKTYFNSHFNVTQIWKNRNGITIGKLNHVFSFFCDFAFFLKNDLSNADLISCDGFINLSSIREFCMDGVLLSSETYVKFGLPFSEYLIRDPAKTIFNFAFENEIKQESKQNDVTQDFSVSSSEHPYSHSIETQNAERNESNEYDNALDGDFCILDEEGDIIIRYDLSDYEANDLADDNYDCIEDFLSPIDYSPIHYPYSGSMRRVYSSREPNSFLETKIYYVSDLHLDHFLYNQNVHSKTDVIKRFRCICDTIEAESEPGSIVLINGDTSCNFSLFKAFISVLSSKKRTFFFTLGNHDLWSQPNSTFEEIEELYRDYLRKHNMFLLQNDVYYFESDSSTPHRLSSNDITHFDSDHLHNLASNANFILFGGIGFAGYNYQHNASNGLYRFNRTIGYNRDLEIRMTRLTEKLYRKICSSFYDKPVIVMTHMPFPDWFGPASINDLSQDILNPSHCNIGKITAYNPGFIYLNGHTHKNEMYDDGQIHIYSNNQFGYNYSKNSKNPHLSCFTLGETNADLDQCADGIYEISSDDYLTFFQNRDKQISLKRHLEKIFMLKKEGIYCFLCENTKHHLFIMKGGSFVHLNGSDIDYYQNMVKAAKKIKKTLDAFTAIQKDVSNAVRSFGGFGTIHGCIVDIDFFSHIFVNPFDGSLTTYWAKNVVNKWIYPSIPALLEERCPKLFHQYNILINEPAKSSQLSVLCFHSNPINTEVIFSGSTDIYKVSYRVLKMQTLYSNILTLWPDNISDEKDDPALLGRYIGVDTNILPHNK